MQRLIAIVAAVVVAAVVAFFVFSGRSTLDAASAPIEKLIEEGRSGAARAELDAVRGKLDETTVSYLDGLLLVAEMKDADAIAPLEKARGAAPKDWRIASTLAAAYWNTGRFKEAMGVLDAYVAAVPEDERGLAAVAFYALNKRSGMSDPAKALAAVDRIKALPGRFVSPDDRTAVADVRIRRLRTQALIELSRGQESLIDARESCKAYPGDAESWFLLGEAARRLTVPRPDESTGAYRAAVKLVPDDRRYVEQLALALIEFQGDGKEILQLAEGLLAKSPQDPSLQLLHARALVRAKREDDAHAVYRQLQMNADKLPREVRLAVLRNLGVLLWDWKAAGKQGDYRDEAEQLLREYQRQGGVVDDALRPTWNEMEERRKQKDAEKK